MKIELENIGTLHEADLEVGGLTLICGENNTGKTYAAYSLYGYLDFMRSMADGFPERTINKRREGALERRRALEMAGDFQKYTYSYPEIQAELEIRFSKKTDFYSKNMLSRVMAGRNKDFEHAGLKVDWSVSLEEVKGAVKTYMEDLDIDQHEEDEKVQYSRYSRYSRKVKRALHEGGLDITIPWHLDGIEYLQFVLDALFAITMPKPFILSVERTGASIFQGELDFIKMAKLDAFERMLQKQNELDILDVFDIRRSADQRKQIYPRPVRDNINFIRNIKRISKKDSIFAQDKENYKAILDLLGKLVGGKYRATDSGLLFQPKGSKSTYPIEIASSSVRSLLMLNYYILHVAQKNDILMIDEPELNLHPNNQILMGRLLALLVNAGIKVFITTHSDYIVRELSNCIMLKNLNTTQIEGLKKQGYTLEYGLDANRVRAYVTKTIKKKNTLTSAKITQEQGIFMQTFDEPIETQNENQNMISDHVIQNMSNRHDSQGSLKTWEKLSMRS
ncbi:AAA family ATPase [Helicobacter labacensis]|uniref:AAA family ATPase n=1 Tax=Helicobacter labacensis TaxID=2316079 RepID=UPI0013CE18ED|nr:AAA family ATPase [Helicobacter labacensis]